MYPFFIELSSERVGAMDESSVMVFAGAFGCLFFVAIIICQLECRCCQQRAASVSHRGMVVGRSTASVATQT